MKVIALNGSKRKVNTYNTLKKIQVLLEKQGIALEIINLFEYDIRECIGCMKCIEKDRCVFEQADDVRQLMEKLIQCDGIILASPVYMKQVSGRMKTFIDRTCRWYHRTAIYGKPSFAIATTSGSGLNETLAYLEDVSVQWGLLPMGSIGLNIRNVDRDITLKELEDFIDILKKGNKQYKPSIQQLKGFQLQKILAMKLLETDKKYWLEKGWQEKDFYIDCHISWHKKIVSRSFYKVLSRVIKSKKV